MSYVMRHRIDKCRGRWWASSMMDGGDACSSIAKLLYQREAETVVDFFSCGQGFARSARPVCGIPVSEQKNIKNILLVSVFLLLPLVGFLLLPDLLLLLGFLLLLLVGFLRLPPCWLKPFPSKML